jgi:hypothetical protein
MVQEVLRATAENELRAQECTPQEQTTNPLGQFWQTPWGHRLFLQWQPPDGLYVDEEHLRTLLHDIQLYRPTANPSIN